MGNDEILETESILLVEGESNTLSPSNTETINGIFFMLCFFVIFSIIHNAFARMASI